MNFRTLITATVLASCAAGAWAQPGPDTTPRIDQRQVQQERRIEHGRATGALTRQEARLLKRQQRAVVQAERTARADGVITKRERAHIRHLQQVASRDIRHQANDRQRWN